MTVLRRATLRAAPAVAASRRPVLTVVLFTVTVAVSVAALLNPELMELLTCDLSRLRSGQRWRAATPVLVQPDGWGQLGFNLLGLAVVGAALERRVGRPCWVLLYLVGGAGGIAVRSAWTPHLTGGGSSDAVAALLGAFTFLLVTDRRQRSSDWAGQLYAVFFATYLPTLDLAGPGASIIVGNASIAIFVVSRRVLPPAALSRACLVVVVLGGTLMTLEHNGHGFGILAGTTIAAVVSARRWLLALAGGSRVVDVGLAVLIVSALTLLTWITWARLLGVDLLVTDAGGSRSEVGWADVGVVAASACLLAWVVLRSLQRRWPRAATRAWLSLCLVITAGSRAGPLTLAAGTTSRAALICLHLACAGAVVVALTPPPLLHGDIAREVAVENG